MTIEQEVAALTTATTALLGAVNVGKAVLDDKVLTATEQAANAQANATQVATTATDVSAQASAAAASALAAATSRDLAIAAWGASTAPAETLTAISQSIHVGTVVKSIIYRTDLDSDGGAWRKRCTDKSWFTETLGGTRWIGQQATIAAAWTAAGSTTGAVFQASATAGPITIGRYYSANSSTTVTEVFRGITREFPEQVAIVAEAGRVVIYDLTVPGCPMFLVFKTGGVYPNQNLLGGASQSVTAIGIINGILAFGLSSGGVRRVSFIADNSLSHRTGTNDAKWLLNIGSRNSTFDVTAKGNDGSIVSDITNDIAVTVLDNAEIDPQTLLPRVTIAIATAGGVSVILGNGTVVNSAVTSVNAISIDSLGYIWFGQSSSGNYAQVSTVPIPQMQANWTHTVYRTSNLLPELYYGNIKETKVGKGVVSVGGSLGFSTLKPNPATPAKGMVAYITDKYSSGYQIGDSRFCGLADTVAETIAAPELAPSTAATAGWIAVGTSIVSSNGTALTVAGDGVNGFPAAYFVINTVAGKTYRLTSNYTGNGDAVFLARNGSANSAPNIAVSVSSNGASAILSFTATGATTSINFGSSSGSSSFSGSVSALSCKLADPDRSVKANGLSIVGSLSKTPVAAGAQLVCWSGWSASNYEEQPFSSNLDFGVNEFDLGAWVNYTPLVNLLTWSGDFTNAVWAKSAITTAGNVITASTTTAAFQQTRSVTPGDVLTFAIIAKRGTMTDAKLGVFNGTAISEIIAPTSYYSEINADTDTLVVRTFTVPAGCTSVYIYPLRNSGAIGTTVISGAALFQGTYTAQQLIALGGLPLTTTAAGTTPATVLNRSAATGAGYDLTVNSAGRLTASITDGTTTRTVTAPAALPTATPTMVSVSYKPTGAVELVVNDAVVATATGAPLLTMNNSLAKLTIGNSRLLDAPFQGSIALLTASATAPSQDQRSQVYRDELPLFQPNAQCTIAGTSTAVTALAYDESTDLLHVGTSWGRSAFKGLLRTESEATTTGAITSLSASQGVLLTGGTSAKIYQPALQLRDELARKEEAKRALGKVPVFFEYDAIAAQTAFVLPIGYTAKAVYSAEVLKREGSTKAYVRSFDGYRETINFVVAPGAAVWVSIMCVRSN